MNANAQIGLLPDVAEKPGPSAKDGAAVAPVRRQYLQIKRRFPDTILLFRLGDFYETFERDAEVAAEILDIVLTGRDLGKGVRVPMAGIPHHAAESYIARLVAAGHKVAVCEQLRGAEKGRGLIERDVARVVTPGTVTEPAMLDSHRNTYIAAVLLDGTRCGVAYADCSTGEFAATQLVASSPGEIAGFAEREILRIGAAEVLMPDGSGDEEGARWLPAGVAISRSERWRWTFDHAHDALCQHFAVEALDGFGLAEIPAATRAAGALIAYIAETQRASLPQLQSLRTYSSDGFMVLDAQARRTLELSESSRGEKRHGLIAVLDETYTPMGARLLRRWLSQPLLDLDAIEARLDSVERYVDDTLRRASTRRVLSRIADIERLANRAATGPIAPRELGHLRLSLSTLAELTDELAALPEATPCANAIQACQEVRALLDRALADEIPPVLGSGGVIRPGFSPELDGHERAVRDSRAWIAGLERQERERTGIQSLRVAFNRISGYYIEIGTAALATAEKERAKSGETGSVLPVDYLLRQSLATAVRYVTADLKDREARILGAQETLAQLEADVYRRVVAEVGRHYQALCEVAAAIAHLDVAATLAEIASRRGYVRPTVDNSADVEIVDGRHPTLESLFPQGEFVPNDALLNGEGRRITILTGPNMAGKSSWLRQTALIVLLAQIGSFVPAARARIGLVDRIFTRIGAQDDITTGQSTFMVEMLETANILNHATPRSLVLLDEIGRGTSTWDGLAIARGVIEHLHNAPGLGARTLFATHFHELTELTDILPGVCCARMDVLEEGDRVVFLHRVVDGAADRSYGIHVAELAGIPRALTRRAREILADLEQGPTAEVMHGRRRTMTKQAPDAATSIQLTLFASPHPAVEILKDLDVDSLTPLEALTRLYELKRLAASD